MRATSLTSVDGLQLAGDGLAFNEHPLEIRGRRGLGIDGLLLGQQIAKVEPLVARRSGRCPPRESTATSIKTKKIEQLKSRQKDKKTIQPYQLDKF